MMAKRELFGTAFGGWLFRKLGAIEVEREATDRGALRVSQQVLRDGEPLAIFPEGTRRTGPTIDELYDGVAYLALKGGVPILPIGIGGTEQILPTGKVLPRVHKVAIVIGEPIVPPHKDGVQRRSEVAEITARAADATSGVLRRGDAPRGRRAGAGAVRVAGPRERLKRRPSGHPGAGRRACGSRRDRRRRGARQGCRAPGAARGARVAVGSTRPRR